MPHPFYERPTLVTVFAKGKKSEEDFCFYEKRQKAKIAFGVCFAMNDYRGSTQLKQGERHSQGPSPELHSTSQHQAP